MANLLPVYYAIKHCQNFGLYFGLFVVVLILILMSYVAEKRY